jgi:hypothetical protein
MEMLRTHRAVVLHKRGVWPSYFVPSSKISSIRVPRQQEPLKGDLMSRTLVIGFVLIVALANATIVQTQTVAKPVGIGEAAPDFTLVDHNGNKVRLSDFKGKSPVVLVFYRGYW